MSASGYQDRVAAAVAANALVRKQQNAVLAQTETLVDLGAADSRDMELYHMAWLAQHALPAVAPLQLVKDRRRPGLSDRCRARNVRVFLLALDVATLAGCLYFGAAKFGLAVLAVTLVLVFCARMMAVRHCALRGFSPVHPFCKRTARGARRRISTPSSQCAPMWARPAEFHTCSDQERCARLCIGQCLDSPSWAGAQTTGSESDCTLGLSWAAVDASSSKNGKLGPGQDARPVNMRSVVLT